MRFPILLLDADDTLFDFHASEVEAFSQTLRQYGVEPTPVRLHRYHEINQGYWKLFEQGRIEKPDLLTRRFADFFAELGLTPDPAEVNDRYLHQLSQTAILLPGAEDLCRRLHRAGHKQYIVTNGTKIAQQGRMARSGLLPYLDGVFISEEIGCQKPQKAFFDAVFAAIGSPDKAQVLIFGDSLSSDMRGGRAAGITTCWYNPKGLEPTADCDLQVQRLQDLPDLVR